MTYRQRDRQLFVAVQQPATVVLDEVQVRADIE
jgi:hypothetical protein